MNNLLKLSAVILASSIAAGSIAEAQPAVVAPGTLLNTIYEPQFPGTFRISAIGGGGPMMGDTSNGDRSAMFAAALVGFGSGMFSVEAGAGYMRQAIDAQIIDDGTATHGLVEADSLAFPIWVKYNYIEKPLAAFFLKAGVIPTMVMSQSVSKPATLLDNSTMNPEIATSDVLATAGFGGTAPLTNHTAFVLDLSYFHGMMPTTEGGAVNQGALVSIGFSYDL